MSGFLLPGKVKASFSLPSRIHNYMLELWIRAPTLGRDDNLQAIDLGALNGRVDDSCEVINIDFGSWILDFGPFNYKIAT